MKRITLTLSLILTLLFPINSASSATVKAGSACKGVNATQIVADRVFTCVKIGKKLVWNSGQLNYEYLYSTDQGFKSNFLGPCDSDPDLPSQWAEFSKYYASKGRCQWGYRMKKYELGSQLPKQPISSTNDLLSIEACKIKDLDNAGWVRAFPGPSNSNKAFRSVKRANYVKPNTIIQVVPIYSPDSAAPTKSPRQDYEKYFNFLKNWAEYVTDGNSNIQIRYPDKYLEFGKPLAPYNIWHHGQNGGPLALDLIAAVDKDIDFSGAQIVVVVVPSGTSLKIIQQGPIGTIQTNEGQIYNASAVYPDTYSDPTNLEFSVLAHPRWWVHELYHLGLGLDDHYGDDAKNVNTEFGMGYWSLMTPGDGDLTVWEKWFIGFVKDEQARCASKDKTTTHWLMPSSVKGLQSKVLAIPLSSEKVIVVESVRAAGIAFKLPVGSQGALVYVVDVTKTDHGQGMKIVLPSSRSVSKTPFFLADAPLKNGESVIYEKVKITVIESGNFGDVIKVEKSA
jgi:hypothetical protein